MSLIVKIRKKLDRFYLAVDMNEEADITCLLGASGSGKSMTLKCIAGLERPDEGHIEVNGRVLYDSEMNIDLSPQERHVGYLFQNYALFPTMTVRRNILISRHRQIDDAEVKGRFEEIILMLQLEKLLDRYPRQLSGGEQQRTALARILMSRPEILLLDEPFTALDAHLREKLQMQMKDLLKNYGQQVVMVTHDRDEAYRMADSAGVLSSGRLIVLKPVKALYRDPEYVSAALLIGCKNITPAKVISEHELSVPEWGLHLHTKRALPPHISHIGIKAHGFGSGKQFMFPVCYDGGMDDTFEYIIRFRFLSQDDESEDIWWKVPAAQMSAELPPELGFNEDAVLLLHGEESVC